MENRTTSIATDATLLGLSLMQIRLLKEVFDDLESRPNSGWHEVEVEPLNDDWAYTFDVDYRYNEKEHRNYTERGDYETYSEREDEAIYIYDIDSYYLGGRIRLPFEDSLRGKTVWKKDVLKALASLNKK